MRHNVRIAIASAADFDNVTTLVHNETDNDRDNNTDTRQNSYFAFAQNAPFDRNYYATSATGSQFLRPSTVECIRIVSLRI
jgi:hypothetical protein